MNWNNKRYRSLDYTMKEAFGEKVAKVSLDGGFTCPNRDGTLDHRGCIFCSELGSGEFAGDVKDSIAKQIESQKELISGKWNVNSYIAYFQNYTNTYGQVSKLERIYHEALNNDEIKGLAIATRPDCLSEEVLDLLEEISKKSFLWIELGLQSIHKKTSDLIRRHYELECFEKVMGQLKKRNIKVVIHLILGLPNESYEDYIESLKYVNGFIPFGVKFHMLNIIKNTDLADYYLGNKWDLLHRDEYIKWICDSIELLDDSITIHRLTGDAKHSELIEPIWIKNKRAVLNGIDKELKTRGSYQGMKTEKN